MNSILDYGTCLNDMKNLLNNIEENTTLFVLDMNIYSIDNITEENSIISKF
jgi:hypothetical protein